MLKDTLIKVTGVNANSETLALVAKDYVQGEPLRIKCFATFTECDVEYSQVTAKCPRRTAGSTKVSDIEWVPVTH